jgi:hypothetical protein
VVIGGVIAVATRAIFKPLSYLTACYLLNANAAKLKEEANDINNKKKLAAELSYKVLIYTFPLVRFVISQATAYLWRNKRDWLTRCISYFNC